MLRKIMTIEFGILFLAMLILPCTAYAYATLSWEGVDGDVTGYRIYYGVSQGDYTDSKDVGNVTQYSLTGLSLTEGETYYFVVRAYNSTIESENSDEVSWTVTDTTPPMTPSGLTFNQDNLTLQWNANTESDLKDYRVYYGTAERNYASFVSNGKNTSISAAGLETGKTYYFAVSAVDISGYESGYSNEAQGTITESDDAPATDNAAPTNDDTAPATDDTTQTTGVVTAIDEDRDTATQPILIEKHSGDSIPPVITRITPTSWGYYFTRRKTIDLSGMVTDSGGVDKVEWMTSAGQQGTAEGTNEWMVTGVKLSGGWNDITITATDKEGNKTEDTLSVICWSF